MKDSKKHTLFRCLILLISVFFILSKSTDEPEVKVQLHFLPHTHLDAGWLLTFEQYYQQDVKQILDSLTSVLAENPQYKFNWAEIGFLHRWWQDQTHETKQMFKGLVKNGQIQLVGGGWVVNDEAIVEYYNVLENLKQGHKFIQNELEASVPHVGWMMDSFGNSQTTATLFQQLEYDTLFLARQPANIKKQLREDGHLQFVWEGHESDQILVYVTQQPSYGSFDKFKFTTNWWLQQQKERDSQKCVLQDILDKNDKCLVYFKESFITPYLNTMYGQLVQMKSDVYHIPVVFGDDFAYTDMENAFKYIEALMAFLQSDGERFFGFPISAKISTVDEYLAGAQSEELTYPMFSGDFLPYYSIDECESKMCESESKLDMWTGYYSTKPYLKQMIRDCFKQYRMLHRFFSFIQTVKEELLVMESVEISNNLEKLGQDLSILLHHDAVTGTHSSNAKLDYYNRAREALNLVNNIQKQLSDLFEQAVRGNSESKEFKDTIEQLLQEVDDGEIFLLKHLNENLISESDKLITAKIPKDTIPVAVNSKLEILETQVLPNIQWDLYTQTIKEQDSSDLIINLPSAKPQTYEIILILAMPSTSKCLEVVQLALGKKVPDYTCKGTNAQMNEYSNYKTMIQKKVSNKVLKVELGENGLISEVENLKSKISQGFESELLAYPGKVTFSGLYVFNPIIEAQEINNLEIQKAISIQGLLKSCIFIFSNVTKYAEMHLENKICLDQKGPNQEMFDQQIRVFSNSYQELTLRMQLEGRPKQDNVYFYTDDSMRSISRPVLSTNEAFGLGQYLGGEQGTLALNSYPCNSGLLIQADSGKQLLGIGLSHSVTCILNTVNQNRYSFEFLLQRSLKNSDHKGVDQISNLDLTFPALKMMWNYEAVGKDGPVHFYQMYSQGKQELNQQEFQNLQKISDSAELGSILLTSITAKQDIQDIVETFGAFEGVFLIDKQFDIEEGLHQMIFENRNSEQLMINKLDTELAAYEFGLIPNLMGEFETKNKILKDLKPDPVTFEETFKLNKEQCDSETYICIDGFSTFKIALKSKTISPEQLQNFLNNYNTQKQNSAANQPGMEQWIRVGEQVAQNSQNQEKPQQQEEDNKSKYRKRKRPKKSDLPIEGDQRSHFCIWNIHLYFVIVLFMGSSVFFGYALRESFASVKRLRKGR